MPGNATKPLEVLPDGRYDLVIAALGYNKLREPMAVLVVDNGPRRGKRLTVPFNAEGRTVGARLSANVQGHRRRTRRGVEVRYTVTAVGPAFGPPEWTARTAQAFVRKPPCS